MTQTTALQWFEAKERGERLKAHRLETDDLHCGLCGEGMAPHEFSQAVRDVANMDICGLCLEAMTESACASH